MRLIDTDACPALFDAEFKETKRLILNGEKHLDNLAEGFMEAHNVIRSMPSVDAAQVVHGRWIGEEIDIETGDISATLQECSVCHRIRPVDLYCAHCGAKMDLNDGGKH